MPWKNLLQLEEEYQDPEWRDRFAELFALRTLLGRSIVEPGYQPPDAFAQAISLSPAGEEWVQRIRSSVPGISLGEARHALFLELFHQDLFIDVDATDAGRIRKALEAQLLGGKIRYPWVYGRLLYDRFYELFPGETDRLSSGETSQLLEDSPQGVFQMRDILVGPFGVLSSSCHRLLLPPRSVPLWHCSDPSCSALHPVELTPGQSKVSEAVEFMRAECRRTDGSASEWGLFFETIANSGDWYDDMHLEHFSWFLVNAFSTPELRSILRRLIERHSSEMRAMFPQSKRFAGLVSGSAGDIAKRMALDQCVQLVLLMSNESIAGELECLIAQRIINIPSTETRVARVGYGTQDWLGTSVQFSRFGVRTVARHTDIAVARLKRLITWLFDEAHQSAQLEWELRHVDAEGIERKLERYLHTEDPKRILRELILTSPDQLRRSFEHMRYGWFVVPSSPEEEDHLVDKILWKLGFDVGLYPRSQSRFWERLDNFLDVARRSIAYDEREREAIRSAGVNFFVSLEEILDQSLSFATWALLADHYGVTKFKCNLDEARRFMAMRLTGLQHGSNEPLEFDPDGKNTLYPLIQGFAILSTVCNEVIEGDPTEMRRPENERPGYYLETEIQLFPFLHSALVLDLGKEDRDRITALLNRMTNDLEAAQVHAIRNRLEHRRPAFPTREEIEAACTAVRDTVNELEVSGICPLIFLYSGTTSDQYGRGTAIHKDYKGREIGVRRPSQYTLCGLPALRAPQIIVPSMHVGDSSELMRFEYVESSDYVELWRDYPKRRLRMPSDQIDEQGRAQVPQAD